MLYIRLITTFTHVSSREQVLEVWPFPEAPCEEHIPQTDIQLGRNPQQPRRSNRLPRIHLLLQGKPILEVRRQDLRGEHPSLDEVNGGQLFLSLLNEQNDKGHRQMDENDAWKNSYCC